MTRPNIRRALLASTVALTAAIAVPASAIPIFVTANAALTTAPYTFSFGSSQFTFSATGDIFNPLAVRTSTDAAISSFGGFLGIPVSPTSSFTNRGTVTFGPGMSYASFPQTTTVPYSNGENFIGLRATQGGQTFYGFAFTTNTTFNGFGFETSPNTAITATRALGAVPEPASWALMIAGFGMVGVALRRTRRTRMVFN